MCASLVGWSGVLACGWKSVCARLWWWEVVRASVVGWVVLAAVMEGVVRARPWWEGWCARVRAWSCARASLVGGVVHASGLKWNA